MVIRTISSQSNPTLKMIRSLQKRKYRELQGAFVIEGNKMVEEALEQAAEVILILATHSNFASKDEDWLIKLQRKSIKTYLVSKKIFASVSQTENPQGILAVVKKQESSWERILGLSSDPFLLILDGIQDPGNLGTILRTAAAAGVSGVLLTTGTVDLYNEKVLRATMGSIFHLPMRQNVDPQELVDVCSRERLPLILADPRSTRPYFHWDFTSRMALVIGNESTGPGEILRMAATETVVIPMPGQLESLNAAVAAGILLFERVRQSF
ncbi:MAG: RNA methyltransferase [Clostridia bacterium]|jgi:TrmH family RNA methyltransferase|nr:RNA methyltransferase [Clostridia bacterium]